MLDGSSTIGASGSGATYTGPAFRELYDMLVKVSPNAGTESWDALNTVSVPDFRGRGVFGLDSMGGSAANRITHSSADTLGGTAGAESISEVPKHTHPLTGLQNLFSAIGGGIALPAAGSAAIVTLDVNNTDTAGTTASVSVVPPCIFLNWMVNY